MHMFVDSNFGLNHAPAAWWVRVTCELKWQIDSLVWCCPDANSENENQKTYLLSFKNNMTITRHSSDVEVAFVSVDAACNNKIIS